MNKEAITVKNGEGDVLSVLGTKVRFLLEAARTDHSFSLMEGELPKDQGPPPHDHPWDEAYYIIDGDVWFMVDDKEQVYSAGDFIYAPGGTLHSFRGAGEKPARVLVFDAPATQGAAGGQRRKLRIRAHPKRWRTTLGLGAGAAVSEWTR